MKQKAMRAVSAFTRIELIVVIVIIGLLATVLLPPWGKHKSKATRIMCLNDLNSSAGFNQNWLRNDRGADNWPAGHIPSSPSIRLIFP